VEPTQPVTPSSRRRCTKWVDQLIKEARERVEAPTSIFRKRKPPQRYIGCLALMTELIDSNPSSYKEASSQQVWPDAMAKEYSSIMCNDVWEIVPKPEGKYMVGSCWVYKIKQGVDGSVEKFKAIFVAKGFSQVEGIDYNETFAPIERYSSVRVILAISKQMRWKFHQMDVKTTFLNEVVEEEIYVE
jgi:hypothetical protein